MSTTETQVAVAGGTTSISRLSKGDMVLAAVVSPAGLTWSPQPVAATIASPPSSRKLVLIELAETRESLIVDIDQPFLLHDGAMKRAELLQLTDLLMSQSGKPTSMDLVSLGEALMDLYAIEVGTTRAIAPGGSLDNHLIAIGSGIVVGDFDLQRGYAPFPPGPEIGPAIDG